MKENYSSPYGLASFFCPSSISPNVQLKELLGLLTDLSSSCYLVTLALYHCLEIFSCDFDMTCQISVYHISISTMTLNLTYYLLNCLMILNFKALSVSSMFQLMGILGLMRCIYNFFCGGKWQFYKKYVQVCLCKHVQSQLSTYSHFYLLSYQRIIRFVMIRKYACPLLLFLYHRLSCCTFLMIFVSCSDYGSRIFRAILTIN